MKRIFNKSSGVTLIALIVTVVVLLILSGVSFVALTSKDDVLHKTLLAKEKVENYSEKESQMVDDTLKYPKSSKCKHENTEKRNMTGTYSGDTYCLDCGAILTTGMVIECEDHPSTVLVNYLSATCCTKGYTGDRVCSVCRYVVTPGTEIDYNPIKHSGGTEIRNATDSYTGDKYCLGCGALISKGSIVRTGLEVGDYVNYTYDAVSTSYLVSGEYSRYRADGSSTINQNIDQTKNLKWRVLSINSDGSVDLISDTQTNEILYFQGCDGYNNAYFI